MHLSPNLSIVGVKVIPILEKVGQGKGCAFKICSNACNRPNFLPNIWIWPWNKLELLFIRYVVRFTVGRLLVQIPTRSYHRLWTSCYILAVSWHCGNGVKKLNMQSYQWTNTSLSLAFIAISRCVAYRFTEK